MIANVIDGNPTTAIPGAILADIRNGKYRAKVLAIRKLYQTTLAETGDVQKAKNSVSRLKKNLPAIQWSGVFKGRGDKNVEKYSNLLCADLDEIDDAAIKTAFNQAQKDPHVFAAFRSPTDTGLKIVFRVTGEPADHKTKAFPIVRDYVKTSYGLEVDESCKNIERLCFVSDSETFYNNQSVPLEPVAQPPEKSTVAEPAPTAQHVNREAPSKLTPAQITTRRKVACDILGTILWQPDGKGFFECPAIHGHSGENGLKDTQVCIDGKPTVHCLHNSCRGVIEQTNTALREAIQTGDKKAGLFDKLAARKFNIHVRPPEIQPRYFIGTTPVSTAGNITAISAGIKSGKSSFIGAMLAATMANEDSGDCLGVVSRNTDGLGVIHLDTEQSVEDHFALIERALRRAGLNEPPSWLQSYCMTGFSVTELALCLDILVEQAAKEFSGIHSILIDGVADMVADVNDPAECNGFVTQLHALAIKQACPVIGVIHFNPGSDKTRGHLGSQLERKAETNLRLDKDGDSIVVWSERNRRAPITKAHGPRFTWSDEQKMHVSIESVGAAQAAADRETMCQQAAEVFTKSRQNSLSWNEFLTPLRRVCNVKTESGARKRMEKMIGTRVITKDVLGHYILTQ